MISSRDIEILEYNVELKLLSISCTSWSICCLNNWVMVKDLISRCRVPCSYFLQNFAKERLFRHQWNKDTNFFPKIRFVILHSYLCCPLYQPIYIVGFVCVSATIHLLGKIRCHHWLVRYLRVVQGLFYKGIMRKKNYIGLGINIMRIYKLSMLSSFSLHSAFVTCPAFFHLILLRTANFLKYDRELPIF